MVRRKDAKAPSPDSTSSLKPLKVIKSPLKNGEITVSSERQLLAMARPLAKRLAADPEFSVMLLANPVLALAEYGIQLSPRMRDHVMQALRYPSALRKRQATLEKTLTEQLGEKPKPNDSKWLANLVFETRGLKPLDLAEQAPIYRTTAIDAAIARAQKGRPEATRRYSGARRIQVTARLGVAPPDPAIRRLDLDAPVPKLEPARTVPTGLTIEEAWFYKDDPVVHDAVELGQIERRGFPFRTPAQFRKIQKGEIVDGFRAFVTRISLEPGKKP